jgi:uncharacterized lipoprotein YehR (DUF1307 family)
MKRISFVLLMAAAMMVSGCGTTGLNQSNRQNSKVLGDIFGAVTNGTAIGNVITSVIGLDKVTQQQIQGTWKYKGPGCAFSSEQALAKAGGEIAAVQVEEKLKPYYDNLKITAGNTWFTFNEDQSFKAQVAGKSISGTYTLNEKDGQMTLKTLLFSINGYAKREVGGISILFESKKLLTIFQAIAAISGNQALEGIGEISKNYDGVRIGFDLKR